MKLGEAVVLHDLLPENVAAHLRDIVLSEDFPWFWNERTLEEFQDSTHQFTHLFWANGKDNSGYSYLVFDIIRATEEKLNIKMAYLSRAKANLLCTLGDVYTDQQHEIHTDLEKGERLYSVVYYVGNSDGDTVVFADSGEENARAQHKNNSAVVFNSLSKHRATLPRKHKRRVVMNIVFQTEER